MALALPHGVTRVVELGAGTGAITRALLRYRVRPENLLVLELNPDLCRDLHTDFPEAKVVCGDARELPKLLASTPGFEDSMTDAVVSSLGFLSMPPQLIEQIIAASFRCLPPGGIFVQYTYGPKFPVRSTMLRRMGLRAERVDFTLLNLPPASVYVLRRTQVRGTQPDRAAGLTRERGPER